LNKAIAPWAAQLKNSEFTKVLLEKAAQTEHRLRAFNASSAALQFEFVSSAK
jgi:hypothetical protein